MSALFAALVVVFLVLAFFHSGWWLLAAMVALVLTMATVPATCPNCGQKSFFRETKQGTQCLNCRRYW